MLEPPTIVQLPARRAAVIHLTIPRDEIQAAMGPAFAELMAAIAAQGIATEGAWFSHHSRLHPDSFDFDVGFPVASGIATSGRVVPGELPAATAARAVLHGGYEGLGPAWEEFEAWVTASGRTPLPNFWEVYTTGPESSPEPANWRTELYRPLAT